MENNYMKIKRKKASTTSILFTVLFGILFSIPTSFINIPEDINVIWIVWWCFTGGLFLITLIEAGRLLIGERTEKKLLDGKIQAFETTGQFVGSSVKIKSWTKTYGHITSFKTYSTITYKYTDENGITRTKKSFTLYSPEEVVYLKNLGNFRILANKNCAVIIEKPYPSYSNEQPTLHRPNQNPLYEDNQINPINHYIMPKIIALTPTIILPLILIIWMICSLDFKNPDIINVVGLSSFIFIELMFLIKLYIPMILFRVKAKTDKGLLMQINNTEPYYGAPYPLAVIKYMEITANVPVDDIKNFQLLQPFVGQEIPIIVYKKRIIIDFLTLKNQNAPQQYK